MLNRCRSITFNTCGLVYLVRGIRLGHSYSRAYGNIIVY